MIDASKLQYFTMAAWMRGYASSLDQYEHEALKHKMNKAADMLDAVFAKYQDEQEERTPKPVAQWYPPEDEA